MEQNLSLNEQWLEIVRKPREHNELDAFWRDYYLNIEMRVYKYILENPQAPICGSILEIAKKFNIQPTQLCGIIAGINSSLKNANEYDVSSFNEQTQVILDVNLELLYANMIEAKASWLHTLPIWAKILTDEKRAEIAKQFIDQSVVVASSCGHNHGGCAQCACGHDHHN